MNTIKELIQNLVKTQDELYSKVGIFKNNYIDKPYLCDVTLLDGVELNNVRLSADPLGKNYTVPQKGSSVIVTFLSKEEAFINLISNAEYTVMEVLNDVGEPTTIQVLVEDGKAKVNFNNISEYNVSTKNNGKFTIGGVETDNTFRILNVDKIYLGIKNGSNITIDKEQIEVASVNKITIGNDALTLKDLLLEVVDVLLEPNIFTSPTVVLLPTVIADLQALKVKINDLFL